MYEFVLLTLYKCAALFLSRFHPNNVLGIRSFADTLGCYALITEADRYIHQYFHDVSVADEYLNLTCPVLLSILQSDELHVFSEEQVGV
jgi:kelch-like protein 18